MTQPAPEPSITTTKDIVSAIEERSGVDLATTGIPDHCAWFPPPGSAAALVFAVGDVLPLKTTFTVMFLFQDEEEVRVYAGPNSTSTQPEMLRCYTLSKTAPIYFCEKLSVEAFIQSVSDEWVLKAEGQTSAEREREQILEYLDGFEIAPGMSPAEVVATLRGEIEAGDHLEGEDEPEEPEVPGAPATDAPPPVAPTEPAPAPLTPPLE